MLNNRELASLILIAAAILALATLPGARRALAEPLQDVARALFKWKIVLSIGLLLTWIAGCVTLAAQVRLWDTGLLKDTILIVFLFALPATFSAVSAKSGTAIFKNLHQQTLSLTALAVMYVNLEPFPLIVELLMQPFAVFLQLMSAFSERDAAYRSIGKLTRALLTITGLSTIVWATFQVVRKAGTYDAQLLSLTTGMSVWLPLAIFPFLYLFAFATMIEQNFVTLRWCNDSKKLPPSRVRLAVVLGMHFSLATASRFNGRYRQVAQSTTFREAFNSMREFRADLRRRDEAESQRISNLAMNAGTRGVDDHGAQLDRREFLETKQLLTDIATSQGGRYETRGDRFWNDLTEMTVSRKSYSLPEPHGITVETTSDQKKWRAWRRMPSGWVLGVGGLKPGDEYMYQAPETPTTWPGGSVEWVNSSTQAWPADWNKNDRAMNS